MSWPTSRVACLYSDHRLVKYFHSSLVPDAEMTGCLTFSAFTPAAVGSVAGLGVGWAVLSWISRSLSRISGGVFMGHDISHPGAGHLMSAIVVIFTGVNANREDTWQYDETEGVCECGCR